MPLLRAEYPICRVVIVTNRPTAGIAQKMNPRIWLPRTGRFCGCHTPFKA
jgi:hypothetical protein